MDELEFTKLMIRYEELYKDLKDVEEKIVKHILDVGETKNIAHVTARYSGGRSVYDYEKAGKKAPKDIIEKHTKTLKKTDWRKVCKEADIDKDEIPLKNKPTPSVSISVDV